MNDLAIAGKLPAAPAASAPASRVPLRQEKTDKAPAQDRDDTTGPAQGAVPAVAPGLEGSFSAGIVSASDASAGTAELEVTARPTEALEVSGWSGDYALGMPALWRPGDYRENYRYGGLQAGYSLSERTTVTIGGQLSAAGSQADGLTSGEHEVKLTGSVERTGDSDSTDRAAVTWARQTGADPVRGLILDVATERPFAPGWKVGVRPHAALLNNQPAHVSLGTRLDRQAWGDRWLWFAEGLYAHGGTQRDLDLGATFPETLFVRPGFAGEFGSSLRVHDQVAIRIQGGNLRQDLLTGNADEEPLLQNPISYPAWADKDSWQTDVGVNWSGGAGNTNWEVDLSRGLETRRLVLTGVVKQSLTARMTTFVQGLCDTRDAVTGQRKAGVLGGVTYSFKGSKPAK